MSAAGRRYELHMHVRDQPLAIVIEPLDALRCRVWVNEHAEEIEWGAERVYAWEELAA
jgi:hypothetical protein